MDELTAFGLFAVTAMLGLHSGSHLVRSRRPEMVDQAERMRPWQQINSRSPAR